MPMTPPGSNLLVLRHGTSVWNLERRWQGQRDVPLAPLGQEQAINAANVLHGSIDAVASSTLMRAADTADIISRVASIERLDSHPELMERYASSWEGLTRAEIEATWPGGLDSPQRPDGYEGPAEVLARSLPVLEALLDRAIAEQRTLAAVTHGGVMYNLAEHIGAEVPHISNLCGMWLGRTSSGAIEMLQWFDPAAPGDSPSPPTTSGAGHIE